MEKNPEFSVLVGVLCIQFFELQLKMVVFRNTEIVFPINTFCF